MNNQVYNYNGSAITFLSGNGDVMVNASQMSQPFSKQPAHWLRTQSSHDYVKELTAMRNCIASDLVKVINGDNGGTWFHEDVALEFARWLSPAFAIWCNDRIKELLKTGVTTVNNDDEVIAMAMSVLQKRLDSAKFERDQLKEQNTLQTQQLQISAPKVQYYDTVLQSESTYNTNQIAKELGMSAVTLNKKLQAKGIQYRQGGQWLLSSKYQSRSYTKTRTHSFTRSDGGQGSAINTVWTESGRQFIHDLLK